MTISKKTLEVALEALIQDLESLGQGQAIEGNFAAAAELANAGAELEAELERAEELEKSGD